MLTKEDWTAVYKVISGLATGLRRAETLVAGCKVVGYYIDDKHIRIDITGGDLDGSTSKQKPGKTE